MSVGWESGIGLAECFWLGVSQKTVVKMLTGLQSSVSLAGAGGSTFKVGHSRGWQIVVGYQQGISVSCHMDASIQLLQ